MEGNVRPKWRSFCSKRCFLWQLVPHFASWTIKSFNSFLAKQRVSACCPARGYVCTGGSRFVQMWIIQIPGQLEVPKILISYFSLQCQSACLIPILVNSNEFYLVKLFFQPNGRHLNMSATATPAKKAFHIGQWGTANELANYITSVHFVSSDQRTLFCMTIFCQGKRGV